MVSVVSYLGIYRLYEAILSRSIKKDKLPDHIAIILDGNRRWAMKEPASRKYGHIIGADTAENVLEWCHEIGIKTITLYVLSTENLERSLDEINEILSLLRERLEKLFNDDRIDRYQIRVMALGRVDFLSPEIRELLKKLELKTRNYTGHYLNIAVAYGGRAEIVDSVRKIAS